MPESRPDPTLHGTRSPRLLYGGDYNPEQWPEEVWAEDVRLMGEAGVNLVTVGVFSWAHLEPRPGEFDFGWMDRVLDLLASADIGVDLATATASPPPWLTHRHPEVLPVTADGGRLWPGGRQAYCPSSPIYRDAAGRLVEAMARRYSDHPALRMWHCGNEYACHVQSCWCDVSAAAFRDWLRRRYESIEALNEAWATAFWSQRYGDWEEILPPRRAPTIPNPTQQLDFHRFSSDAWLECFELERALLHRHAASASAVLPVTTNFMGFFKPLDYWKWAASEDVVSNDSYPDPSDPDSPMLAAMSGDLMRSLGGGRPWVLMEQTPSRVNWRPRNVAKRPGQMRLWSYQAIARGAEGVMFFQWRQSRAGAEKFHSAMVPHGRVERSRTWREVVQLGGELDRLAAVCGTTVEAEAAILFDWDSWWALELPSRPSVDVRQMDQLVSSYRPLFDGGIAVDFAHPKANLARYRLVVVPNLYLVTDEAAANLARFVEAGGVLVMAFFSGIVDESEHVRLGGYPAPFSELLGLEVEDFRPLADGETVRVRFEGQGSDGTGRIWSELIQLTSAELLGTFVDGPAPGGPAVTRRSAGGGSAYYIATCLDPTTMAAVLARACGEAGLRPLAAVPPGVEAVRRSSGERSLLFLLNHGPEAASLEMPSGANELITGERLQSGTLRLDPMGVAIVDESGRR